MSRVQEFLALIDDPEASSLAHTHPDDGPLTALLLHLALSDGQVDSDEVALLMRVRPDLDQTDIVQWAIDASTEPFEFGMLTALATTEDRASDIVRFAARMVCMDGVVSPDELQSLETLTQAVGLQPEAAAMAINEIVAQSGEITRERVSSSLRNMLWRHLVPERAEVAPALAEVCPEDLEPVCVLTLDDEQVGVLCFDGLAARFDQGAAWFSFHELGSYTRVPVYGAAFHVRTAGGQHLSMSDPRMRDIGALFDFIYGRTTPDA